GRVPAHLARAARLRAVAGRAQERASQQPRGRRLADAPGAREEIGVSDASRGQRIAQGARDRVLPDDLVEDGGTIFPGEDLIAQPPTSGEERTTDITTRSHSLLSQATHASTRVSAPLQ